jgi:hypothetical protein
MATPSERRINTMKAYTIYLASLCIAALLLASACAPAPESGPAPAAGVVEVEVIPPDSEYSGFLGDYSQLKPHPDIEDAFGYLNEAEMKDLQQYIKIIVDPVKIYLATDAKLEDLPDRGREAAAKYFHYALVNSVSDAFRVVDEPGPATLRLRTALVGVGVTAAPEAADLPEGVEALERGVDISEVWIEAELVDSGTGERLAAAVDRAEIGEEARLASSRISRVEAEQDVEEALDEWAARLRDFLDNWHEPKGEEAERRDESYQPY